MQLTISLEADNNVFTVDVGSDLSLADLKAYIEAETNLETSKQLLIFNGNPLSDDEKTLDQLGLKDNDLLMCVNSDTMQQSQQQQQAQSPGLGNIPQADQQKLFEDVERVRQQLKTDPTLRSGVAQTYPQLIELIDDPVRFREEMIRVERTRVQEEEARRQELKRLQDDPYNEENQAKILEMIQQEQIMENLNNALEHNPEVFGRVTMLYVDVMVNGKPVKAFVDSGAQATIMNLECVERCNMKHLIDKRFQGVAKGVGEAKILGRIHSAPMKVGDSFLPCSFTVMEDNPMDMLLGLDMLKRHQGVIDLASNTLKLGDSVVPFLGEAEIPKDAFLGGGIEPPAAQSRATSSTASAPASSSSAAASSSSFRPTSSSSAGGNMSRIADAQPNPRQATANYSDETIQNLMGLGFSRDQVVNALNQAGGNPELAAALLFQ